MHDSKVDFDPLYICMCAMASRAETFNIFQLIPFIYFHFKCDFKCAHGLLNVHEELSVCLVEFDKVETAHKGISRFVSSSKRYFFIIFHLEWRRAKKKCRKILPPAATTHYSHESHPSSYLSLCTRVALYVCRVSFSKYFHNLHAPTFYFSSLFHSPSNRSKLMIMWMIYWL